MSANEILGVQKHPRCAIICKNCRIVVGIKLQISMTLYSLRAPLAVLIVACCLISIMQPVRAADPRFESLFKADEGPLEIHPFHRSREINQECRKYLQFHDDMDQAQLKAHRTEACRFLALISYPYFTPNTKLVAALKQEGVKFAPPHAELTPLTGQLMIKYRIKAEEIDAACNVIRKPHAQFRTKKLSSDYTGSVCATTFQWLKQHERELKEHNLSFENVLTELAWGEPLFLKEYLKGPFGKRLAAPSETSLTDKTDASNPLLKNLAADYSAALSKHWPIWLQDRATELYWHDIFPSQISKYPRGAWPKQSG
jgi:hypothetical protein